MTSFGRSQGRQTVVKLVGADLKVNTGDTTTVLERLERIGGRMRNWQPVLDEFGQYLVEQHIPRQFKAQGTPRWAKLSARYARWKLQHYGRQPILIASGAMSKGFRWQATKRTLRVINQVSAGQGGGEPRWAYHQNGTSRMPARPMVQLTPKDYELLHTYAAAYLMTEQGGGVL
jgi:phage gpG-like protein